MAWVDDRLWAHPKFVGLPPRAWQVAVSAILYSHGFGLYGRLTPEHQKAIGATTKIRELLIEKDLWEEDESDVLIHDWDEHNGKRDDALETRRKSDRERKKREREAKKSARKSQGQSRDSHVDESRDVTPLSSRASAGAPPMTSDRVTSDVSTAAPEARPPADAEIIKEDLQAAGWSANQIAQAVDLERAAAWLAHAQSDPSVRAPGALAWSQYQTGTWPSTPQPDISKVTVKYDHECPSCGLGLKTARSLDDHIHVIHPELERATA